MAFAKPRNDHNIKIKKKDNKTKDLNIDKTSSLNKYFLCDYCGKEEVRKTDLARHITDCVFKRTCVWCNIVFKRRAYLSKHYIKLHGREGWSGTNLSENHTCSVCPQSFPQLINLKYHIRRDHYNLTLKETGEENRKINEAWVERVMNTDAFIEIRKTGLNCYSMRRVNNDGSLSVFVAKESVDLSLQYPTTLVQHKEWCDICEEGFTKRDYRKHMKDMHKARGHRKLYGCNHCSKWFTKLNLFVKHVYGCGSESLECKGKSVPDVAVTNDDKPHT